MPLWDPVEDSQPEEVGEAQAFLFQVLYFTHQVPMHARGVQDCMWARCVANWR